MVKAIALVKRKPGLSRDEFVKHYEEVHAPLALRHLPAVERYVRNHITSSLGSGEPEFDCVTELWFTDMEGYKAMWHFWSSDAGRVIRDNEDSFLDRSKSLFFLVDEKVSK